MRSILILLVLFLNQFAFSQNNIEWEDSVVITLDDFESTASRVDLELKTYSCRAALNIDFYYQMSSIEFMFTKDFNSKIAATFQKMLPIFKLRTRLLQAIC